jgi:hypothetical protein
VSLSIRKPINGLKGPGRIFEDCYFEIETICRLSGASGLWYIFSTIAGDYKAGVEGESS